MESWRKLSQNYHILLVNKSSASLLNSYGNTYKRSKWILKRASLASDMDVFTSLLIGLSLRERISNICEQILYFKSSPSFQKIGKVNSLSAKLVSHSLQKHAYSNILKLLPPKHENFQIKNSDIFHISAQNIDCGYSLEPPR